MNKTKVVFRADGNSKIGLGHVIRSLALAEMLKNDYECSFAIQDPDAELQSQIELICNAIIKLPTISAGDKKLNYELDAFLTGIEIVVLDGYVFETDYQRGIRNKGCKVICIDDIHAFHFVADAIINHSGRVENNNYSKEPYTECFLGPKYALLRSPFLYANRRKEDTGSLKNIFINMGGADPFNDTCKILKSISAYSFFDKIHVVTGSAYRYKPELEYFVSRDSRITSYSSLKASEMAGVMELCGMAICPPSSVSFEYASIGGLLFLKQIADNQIEVKKYFIEQQLAFDYEMDFPRVLHSDLYHESLRVVKNQHNVFDGKSDERLKAIFKMLGIALKLSFRKADSEDLMICFEWANDPEVRRLSYNSDPIALEDHIRWFHNKIKSPNTHFYIIEYSSKPIGQIRFEGTDELIISYLISSEMRGKGLGSLILKEGVKTIIKNSEKVRNISGYVKEENIPSCKAFEKAGFLKSSSSEIPYPNSVKYEMLINP